MKCESCPNRPCDEKKAACDNCIQRKRKAELAEVLSLSFDSFLKKPTKEYRDERFSDDEISERMRREKEETFMAMKREEARRERDREIREENRKGWWK